MDSLWAPWRMEFIRGDDGPSDDRCIFCTLPHEPERLRENLVLARGRHSFVILNKYPYNNGHLMVIPYRHLDDFTALTDEEQTEIQRFTAASIAALRGAYSPDGFNLGMNLGRAGGAGIADHLHQHIVPRWQGDTNFMPVIGQTKSMPEHLANTFDQLRAHFPDVEGEAAV